jgi:hypothetical protein
MKRTRLSHISIDLEEQLAFANKGQRLLSSRKAAEIALKRNGLKDAILTQALESISKGTPSDDIRIELERLVEEYDAAYFDLQDAHDRGEAEKPEVLRSFGKARAVNAVLYAIQFENKQFAEETFYEAHAASVSLEELRKIVEQMLDTK